MERTDEEGGRRRVIDGRSRRGGGRAQALVGQGYLSYRRSWSGRAVRRPLTEVKIAARTARVQANQFVHHLVEMALDQLAYGHAP